MICEEVSASIPAHFADADVLLLKDALVKENFSSLASIPDPIRQHLEECSNCRNDIYWYFDARDEVDVSEYHCIHMAYAVTSHAGNIIEHMKRMGIFGIKIKGPDGAEGIVIGFCP